MNHLHFFLFYILCTIETKYNYILFKYLHASILYSSWKIAHTHNRSQRSMEQPKNHHSELDVQKYYGKNTNYVIGELQKQGQSSDD